MTCEHLRPLLDEVRSMHLLFRLSENLARAHVPPSMVHMVRCGRMTALRCDAMMLPLFCLGLHEALLVAQGLDDVYIATILDRALSTPWCKTH